MEIEKFIIKEVTELVMPLLNEKGMELVDIQYRREGGGWVLRIFIDKEGGVTLNDCVEVSRELGYHLDVKDFIPHKYNLEVSSPGINRPLKKIEDFKRFEGRNIQVSTKTRIENRKNFTGLLKSVSNDGIVIEVDKIRFSIPFSLINKANLKEI